MSILTTFSKLVTRQEALIPPSHTETLNIAFAADKNYAKYIGVALYSVVETNTNSYLCFHLFVDDIAQDDKDKLHKISQQYTHFGIILHYIDDAPLKHLPTIERISTATYYRFAIASILHDVADKVLYLDTDVICLGELHSLFAHNLHDCIAGAVPDWFTGVLPDRGRLHELGFDSVSPYFNAGVLLIHTKQWVAQNIDQKLQTLIHTLSEKQVFFHDQDLLNIALQDRVHWLSEYYNWQQWNFFLGSLSDHTDDIRLAHLLGEIKPWSWQCFCKTRLYDDILKRSPYKDYRYPLPKNPTFKELRRYVKHLWRMGEKHKIISVILNYLHGTHK